MGHPGLGDGTWDIRDGWDLGHGIWDLGHLGTGTSGNWDGLEHGTRDTGLGTWDMGHGTWDLGRMELGIGHPGFGTRTPGIGISGLRTNSKSGLKTTKFAQKNCVKI